MTATETETSFSFVASIKYCDQKNLSGNGNGWVWTGLELYNAVRKIKDAILYKYTVIHKKRAITQTQRRSNEELDSLHAITCLCPPKKAVDERTFFSLCYLCYNRQFSLLIKIPGRQQKIRKLHAQPNAAECPIQCSHFPSTTSKLRHAKCHETTQKQEKEIMGSSNSHLVSG